MMGCYGIGISRLVGAIVEARNDEKGIRWPREVAPYQVHLIAITGKDPEASARAMQTAESLGKDMEAAGIEVLFDDREGLRAGEKFADADLIGLPIRLVVSEKTLAENAVEWKLRGSDASQLVPLTDVIEALGEELRHEKK
jgi:prolyl-tRNA synthetase